MRVLLITLVFGIAIGCFAQTQDVPPAISRVEKKSRTWTNEDLEKLSGPINVMGKEATPAAEKPSATSEKKEEERCESDIWIAAITAVMREQGIPYGPRYWSERLFGDTCRNDVGVGAVASRIEGNYTLDDGKRLRVTTVVTPGLPPAPLVVSSIDERNPLIVKSKKQPLVMTKVDYVDRQYNYVSVYSISGLTLTNPLTGRILLFDMKMNSDKEIDGALQVRVSNRQ